MQIDGLNDTTRVETTGDDGGAQLEMHVTCPCPKHKTHTLKQKRTHSTHRESDPNETAWHRVLQLIGLCEQRHDAGEDGDALDAPLSILGDDPRADLDLLPHAEDTLHASGRD